MIDELRVKTVPRRIKLVVTEVYFSSISISSVP